MKKLYFVRHGQSEMNVLGHFAGHTDTPLTEEGKRQAQQAGRELKNKKIDIIVSSPLSRAHDTAKLIAKEIGYHPKEIRTTDLLRERFYGTAEDTPYSKDEGHLENFEGFETEEEMLERAEEILRQLESLEANHILIVSHGGIGRRIRYHLKPDHDLYDRIPNAKVFQWL